MTERQKRFVDFYIQTGNATEAAKLAGYSDNYAAKQSSKLLANVGIKKAIDVRMAELASERIADAEEVAILPLSCAGRYRKRSLLWKAWETA